MKATYDIQAGTNNIAKNIFTTVNQDVNIGGVSGQVVVGNNLKVPGDIVGTDTNTSIFAQVVTREISIGAAGSTTVISGHLNVADHIKGPDENKQIFTDVSSGNTITIGGSGSEVIIGDNLIHYLSLGYKILIYWIFGKYL